MARKKILIQPYFLTVDKPPDLTSHDVVAILRAVTGINKVGHTGTLDPFATGVLPIALGAATRLIRFLPEDRKTYTSSLKLGVSTDTGDCEGESISVKPVPELTKEYIEHHLNTHIGHQLQKPPIYSAIKVNGRKLYDYARAGIAVEVPPRPICIYQLKYLSHTPQRLTFQSIVSKGTYIRALGEDLAKSLGTVGHLDQLCRNQSGPFTLENALSFEQLSQIVCGTDDWRAAFKAPREERLPRVDRTTVRQRIFPYLRPAAEVFLCYPQIELSEPEYRLVQNGRLPYGLPPVTDRYMGLCYNQNLVAICSSLEDRSAWRLDKVISDSAVSILDASQMPR